MRGFAIVCGVAMVAVASAAETTFEDLNAVFGIPIWGDDNLWDDADTAAGERLRWPEESRTARDSSFRLYAKSDARVLGVRPYSLALYGEGGVVQQISMVFANKGDVESLSDIGGGARDPRLSREDRKAVREFQKVLAEDKKSAVAALTGLLGKPRGDRFGHARQTRELVQRWDWNGHAILVAAPRDEYLAVRIVPVDVADGVRKPRKTDAELKEDLAARVERRPNGDVVITDIPMVNQGPKGFCVPATWERAMRYMGIPADMYILAMAGGTGMGGGTHIGALAAAAREDITRRGRRLSQLSGGPSIRTIAKAIDRGQPVMWAVYSEKGFEKEVSARSNERRTVTDWAAWREALEPKRKAAKDLHISPLDGHVRMIIGYNPQTGEIAISDSWGKWFEERWLTEEEAAAINQGSLRVIDF